MCALESLAVALLMLRPECCGRESRVSLGGRERDAKRDRADQGEDELVLGASLTAMAGGNLFLSFPPNRQQKTPNLVTFSHNTRHHTPLSP